MPAEAGIQWPPERLHQGDGRGAVTPYAAPTGSA